MAEAVALVFSFLLTVRALLSLCSEPTGSMYYFTLGVGGIAIARDLDLKGLDIAVMVVMVYVSCDFRLNQLGDLVDDGFMDDGYAYSASKLIQCVALIHTLGNMGMICDINSVGEIPS